ncbi:hypothetical protein FQR65_LT05962 [Abscondita terminalis]|nr:hypothetical protein FQR65_LT05962 [Abscondita terminalis]
MSQTLRDKKNEIIGKIKQFVAVICLGPITLGSSLSWTAPVLPQLLNANSTTSFHLTNAEGSWVGSMVAVGVLMSALISGYLADRFGVKKITLVLIVPVWLFTVLVLLADNVYVLCLARLFSGIATGGISVVGPMYISEISDISVRGILGSFFEFLIYFGVVVAVVLGSYLDYKILTVIMGISALILSIIFAFFPESPTYLMKFNKRERAEKSLRFYKSEKYNFDKALDEIAASVNKESKKVNIAIALQSKAVTRGLIAGVGLTIIQQLSGIDGVIFYTVQIFQAAGTEYLDPFVSSIIVSVVELFSAVVMLFVVERASRRAFLFASCGGTGVCLLILGVYFHLKLHGLYFIGMGAIPLISVVLYAFMFAVGLGPVLYLMYGELFSPDVKGLAIGIIITTNWSMLFLITKTFPVMMVDIGAHYTFYMYSLCMFLSLIFIKYCVPETRGKSLEQIQLELGTSKRKLNEIVC